MSPLPTQPVIWLLVSQCPEIYWNYPRVFAFLANAKAGLALR